MLRNVGKRRTEKIHSADLGMAIYQLEILKKLGYENLSKFYFDNMKGYHERLDQIEDQIKQIENQKKIDQLLRDASKTIDKNELKSIFSEIKKLAPGMSRGEFDDGAESMAKKRLRVSNRTDSLLAKNLKQNLQAVVNGKLSKKKLLSQSQNRKLTLFDERIERILKEPDRLDDFLLYMALARLAEEKNKTNSQKSIYSKLLKLSQIPKQNLKAKINQIKEIVEEVKPLTDKKNTIGGRLLDEILSSEEKMLNTFVGRKNIGEMINSAKTYNDIGLILLTLESKAPRLYKKIDKQFLEQIERLKRKNRTTVERSGSPSATNYKQLLTNLVASEGGQSKQGATSGPGSSSAPATVAPSREGVRGSQSSSGSQNSRSKSQRNSAQGCTQNGSQNSRSKSQRNSAQGCTQNSPAGNPTPGTGTSVNPDGSQNRSRSRRSVITTVNLSGIKLQLRDWLMESLVGRAINQVKMGVWKSLKGLRQIQPLLLTSTVDGSPPASQGKGGQGTTSGAGSSSTSATVAPSRGGVRGSQSSSGSQNSRSNSHVTQDSLVENLVRRAIHKGSEQVSQKTAWNMFGLRRRKIQPSNAGGSPPASNQGKGGQRNQRTTSGDGSSSTPAMRSTSAQGTGRRNRGGLSKKQNNGSGGNRGRKGTPGGGASQAIVNSGGNRKGTPGGGASNSAASMVGDPVSNLVTRAIQKVRNGTPGSEQVSQKTLLEKITNNIIQELRKKIPRGVWNSIRNSIRTKTAILSEKANLSRKSVQEKLIQITHELHGIIQSAIQKLQPPRRRRINASAQGNASPSESRRSVGGRNGTGATTEGSNAYARTSPEFKAVTPPASRSNTLTGDIDHNLKILRSRGFNTNATSKNKTIKDILNNMTSLHEGLQQKKRILNKKNSRKNVIF